MKSTKMVIILRKDLGMGRSKEIAQGAHAALDFLVEPIQQALLSGPVQQVALTFTEEEQDWLRGGMAKVCLKVGSEAELCALHEKARAAGLKSYLTQDSGKTAFHGVPTFTACAIGPDATDRKDRPMNSPVPSSPTSKGNFTSPPRRSRRCLPAKPRWS